MTQQQAIVHVVDDDEDFRESVRWLLESSGLSSRLYASGAEFLAAVDCGSVGCLVTDMRMPGMSGLELQRALDREDFTLPILVMTAHGDVDTAVQAMKSGAVEFIQKPFKDQAFLDMINAVIEQSYREAETRHAMVDARNRLFSLSAREREVLDLIVEGKTNKATAAALDVSGKTVEAHRASIMQKLGANSLANLVKIVLTARAG